MGSTQTSLHHVVLADDDRDHGLLFHKVLHQIDPSKTLTIVRDGDELMEFLSLRVPDLVFLDLNMPCKDGLECLQEIRKNPALAKLTVVVYTSSTHMTDIQKSYIHKADLYMVKPFNSFHLRNALASILAMDWKDRFTQPRHYFMNNRFVPFTA